MWRVRSRLDRRAPADGGSKGGALGEARSLPEVRLHEGVYQNGGHGMTARKPPATAQARALEMVRDLRREGLDVSRVIVEGRKIEIEVAVKDAPQKIDSVQW